MDAYVDDLFEPVLDNGHSVSDGDCYWLLNAQ